MKKLIFLCLIFCVSLVFGCGDDDNGTDPKEAEYSINGKIERKTTESIASAKIILLIEHGPLNYEIVDDNNATVTLNGTELTIQQFNESLYTLPSYKAFVGSGLNIPAGAEAEIVVTSAEYGDVTKTLTMPGGSFRIASPEQGTTFTPGTIVDVNWTSATNADGYYIYLRNVDSNLYHFERTEASLLQTTGPILTDTGQTGQLTAELVVRAYNGSPNTTYILSLECSVTDDVLLYINQD